MDLCKWFKFFPLTVELVDHNICSVSLTHYVHIVISHFLNPTESSPDNCLTDSCHVILYLVYKSVHNLCACQEKSFIL